MTKLFIPVVLGTARNERESEKVAKWIFEQAQKRDIETEFIDVKDFLFGRTIPSWEENKMAETWRSIAKRADGFIIVSPEYNHGYPGELKMLLDSAYEEYFRKPVAVAAVSNGMFGGARMIEGTTPVFHKLGLTLSRIMLNFAKVEELFDEKGELKSDYLTKASANFFDELLWYARVLRAGRDNA